jgi:hypothetical protein
MVSFDLKLFERVEEMMCYFFSTSDYRVVRTHAFGSFVHVRTAAIWIVCLLE